MQRSDFCARCVRWVVSGVVLAAMGAGQGCGTGAYEERMEKRMGELRRGGGGPKASLYAATQVGDSPLMIRVPQVFKQGLVPGAMVGGKPVSMKRIQPPVTMPGLKATWEGSVDHEGGKLPYYCHLGVTGDDPTGKIKSEIQQLYSGVDVTWKNFTDPAGKTWRRWRGDLDQDWVPLDAAGQEMPSRALPGTLEFDCRQEGSQWMVVGWRVPRAIQSAARLEPLIGPTLGSLKQKGR